MNRLVAIVAAVLLGGALVGCGDTSRPRVDPDLAGKPTWAGCHARSIENTDYTPDADGKPTARAALAPYRTPGDHVVHRASEARDLTRWLLVDDHEVIHASLELDHFRHGWLVGMVEKCSR